MDIAMAYERSTKKCTLELDDDGDINNNIIINRAILWRIGLHFY
jgi:hypothetical protein